MRHGNTIAMGVVAVAVYAMCCAMALGQQVPQGQAGTTTVSPQAGDGSRTSPVGHQSNQPKNNNDAVNAGAMMQRNGGSLLRATMSAQPDAQQAKLAQVSYFAVPEPQPKTMKAHDLVTIIIREQSEFSSNGTTDIKRDASIDARLEEWVKLNTKSIGIQGGVGTTGPVPSVKASGKAEWKGEGTVDRTDSFVARITAEVLDVKPNGTLVLQGKKTIRMDEEQQEFIITGTARAEDVSADNTVLSTQLKDLSLTKTNKGDLRQAQKKGWIPKLLDAINPF